MPYRDDDCIQSSNNRLIAEELDYDIVNQYKDYLQFLRALTNEQRGKTFLWKTLSASIRSRGEIVLNVASSGIASLLLTGGRIAHSRYKIPLILNEDSLCYIKPNTEVAMLIKKSRPIIWDEAPMVHRHAFEAIDRSMKDIFGIKGISGSDELFDGKVVVFGGDFRQILPVIPNANRQKNINASLSSSYIWQKCKVLTLTKNMRLTIDSNPTDPTDIEETRNFARWILDLGEGKLGSANDGEELLDIPDDLLITDAIDPISSLIEFVYPSILHHIKNSSYFQERAILAHKHEVVQELNDQLLSMFSGQEKEYLSSDSLCESEQLQEQFYSNLYSPDVLNVLKLSVMPNHKIVLKVGVSIMLLRNIDQKSRLCNGTRLQVASVGNRVIEAEIIS